MPTASGIEDLTRRNVEAIALMEKAFNRRRTVGDRIADGVAAVIGSWPFILLQTVVLTIWMILNFMGWIYEWDPYPFILLNLVLSFQAAYASPIIMMSQNRQAKLSDRRNHLDLQINMLAEQENTEMLKMLRQLCLKAGIEVENKGYDQPTKPAELLRQIDEKHSGS